MSDIFVSYARSDRPTAETLADALEAEGWSVWWDRDIPAGKSFDEVIEEALTDAGCVIVLWSRASVASRWVRAEAAEGVTRRVLVPVAVEETPIPLPFRQIQTADLTGWDGSRSAPAFQRLVQDVGELLDAPQAPDPAAAAPTEAGEERRAPHGLWRAWRAWVLGAIAALALILTTVLVLQNLPVRTPPPTDAAGAGDASAGRLVLNALPWAEVQAITDEGGQRLELGPEPYTPLALSMPAGTYRISVASPGGEPETLEVEVRTGETVERTVRWREPDVDAYFREVGW